MGWTKTFGMNIRGKKQESHVARQILANNPAVCVWKNNIFREFFSSKVFPDNHVNHYPIQRSLPPLLKLYTKISDRSFFINLLVLTHSIARIFALSSQQQKSSEKSSGSNILPWGVLYILCVGRYSYASVLQVLITSIETYLSSAYLFFA